jgi:hypothetical protein
MLKLLKRVFCKKAVVPESPTHATTLIIVFPPNDPTPPATPPTASLRPVNPLPGMYEVTYSPRPMVPKGADKTHRDVRAHVITAYW